MKIVLMRSKCLNNSFRFVSESEDSAVNLEEDMAAAQELSSLISRLELVASRLEKVQGGAGAASGEIALIFFPICFFAGVRNFL